MDAIVTITIIVFVFLFFLVVIGHGIWVLSAKVFNYITKSDAKQHTVLLSLQNQIDKFADQGLIDGQLRKRLSREIDLEHRRLEGYTIPSPKPIADEPIAAEIVDQPQSTDPAPVQPVDRPSPSPQRPQPTPVVPTPKSVSERAKAYATRRTNAAITAPEPPSPPQPRRHISHILMGFMEEKNIRWGELIGGLLIVVSSIALVINFWAQIAQRPFLKFFIFNGVTTALFCAGLYTERRWKLHTTSRGLLIISMLLVPLNLLAIASFTNVATPTDVVSTGGELLSIVIFSFLVYLAAQIVTPKSCWLTVIGVMLPSATQLLIQRIIDTESNVALLYGIATLPLCCYFGLNLENLRRFQLVPTVDEKRANSLLVPLGVTSYAALLPLALLLYKTEASMGTLHRLSPLVVVLGLPALFTGIIFWQRITVRELSAIRTAGISIGVVGGLLMISAIWLAMPDPICLLPTILLVTTTCAVIAIRWNIPQALAIAAGFFGASWLIGWHWLSGELSSDLTGRHELVKTILTAASGTALLPLTVCLGVAAVVLSKSGRMADSRVLILACGAWAAVSITLASIYGFGIPSDVHGIMWIYAIYAVSAIVTAVIINREYAMGAAWIASLLTLATLIQGCVYRYEIVQTITSPWIVILLMHATIMCVGIGLLDFYRNERHEVRQAWIQSAIASTIAATVLTIMVTWSLGANATPYWLWLSVMWCATAYATGRRELFAIFQFTAAAACCFATAGVLEQQAWYTVTDKSWIDPWFLQAQGTVLALFCILWTVVRRIVAKPNSDSPSGLFQGTDSRRELWSKTKHFLQPSNVTADRVVAVSVFALLIFLAIYSAVPGVAQELAPREKIILDGSVQRNVPVITEFEIAQMPQDHARGMGAWILLTAVSAMLITRGVEGFWQWRLPAIVLSTAMMCPLIAARFDPDVAVASALRWSLGIFFLLASILMWYRNSLFGWIPDSIKVSSENNCWKQAVRSTGLTLLGIALLPSLMMAVYVASASLQKAGIPRALGTLFPYFILLFLLAIGFFVTLRFARWSAEPDSWWVSKQQQNSSMYHVSNVIAVLGSGPLLVIWLFAVAMALMRYPVVQPNLDAWFRQIGLAVNYAVPVLFVAIGLIGHALRERSPRYAAGSALLFNVAATAGFLLVPDPGRKLDLSTWLQVGQINTVVAALFSIGWFAVFSYDAHQKAKSQWTVPGLFVTQTVLAISLCAICIVPVALWLVIEPKPTRCVFESGGGLSWLGYLLTIGSIFSFISIGSSTSPFPISKSVLGAMFLTSLGAMVAFTAAQWDTGNWLAYHTLLGISGLSAWLIWSIGRWSTIFNTSLTKRLRWFMLPGDKGLVAATGSLGTLTVVLALRATPNNPGSLWWVVGSLLAMSVLAVFIAWVRSQREFLYAAGILANMAVSIWWFGTGHPLTLATGISTCIEYLQVSVIAATLPAVLWIAHEFHCRSVESEALQRRTLPGLHRVTTFCGILVLFATISLGLLADGFRSSLEASRELAVCALISTMLGALVCLIDAKTKYAVTSIYLLGLVGVGLLLDSFNLHGVLFSWMLTVIAGAFSLASSYLWSRREGLSRLFGQIFNSLGLIHLWIFSRHNHPDTNKNYQGQAWLVTANGMLVACVTCSVIWIVLTFESFPMRMSAAQTVFAQALALALLARGAVRSVLQYTSLAMGGLFAIVFGWAWLPIDVTSPLLHRMIVVIVALVVMTLLYGFGLIKLLWRENEWTRAAQQLVSTLVTIAIGTLITTIAMEAAYTINGNSVLISWPAIVTVALALLTLCLSALAAAILPGRDPLNISERYRGLYVYVAEAILLLLGLHLRLTIPWLFDGWFEKYWTVITIGIAFVSIGAGEFLRRRRQSILSDPLINTGTTLPLLTVFGFWVVPDSVNYSLLLLAGATLYGTLSLLRKSLLFGVLATVLANSSLWYLLQQVEGMSFLEHPQFWIVPPAICVLIAAYLNRSQLDNEQMTGIRYSSAIVIYASSTTDILIHGVAAAPWLPALLAAISITGIFVGILLQVRAFLYLGTSFLCVALFSVIWMAAVELQHTWVWWVSGIVAGILVITIFAVFEKKRDDIRHLIDHLRHWEP